MKRHENDNRKVPYSNSRMFSPVLIWSIIVTLACNLVLGVVFVIRLEGSIEQNTMAIEVVENKVSAEILHVKELQEQQNDHVKEILEDIKKEQREIKQLLRDALKRQQAKRHPN